MTVLAGGDNSLGAGFIAFVIVLVLAVACYFLFRSMTRQMRKVPASFDEPTSSSPASVTTADKDDL